MDHVRPMEASEGQRPLNAKNVLKCKRGMIHNPNRMFLPMQCMVMDDSVTPDQVQGLLEALRKPKPGPEDEESEHQVFFELATSGGNHFCTAFKKAIEDLPQLGGEDFHRQRAEVAVVNISLLVLFTSFCSIHITFISYMIVGACFWEPQGCVRLFRGGRCCGHGASNRRYPGCVQVYID